MGGGGSAPQPKVITPGEAAQAAVGTAGAGEMMSIANQPVEQYANLVTASELGGAEAQSQAALANRAALLSAQGQMDIQSQVDPLAYAQRQMRLKAATDRLSSLYGSPTSAYSASFPGAYTLPGTSSVAPLSDVQRNAAQLAGNVSTGSVNYLGTDPRLVPPGNPSGTVSVPASYLR